MTSEPVESTATASQAPSRRSRHIPVIEVNAASQPEENSNTMAIPVYNPPNPDMLQPRHARHARLMASEVKLQEWLRTQATLAAATPFDQKPTTTEAEDTTKPSKPATFNTVGTLHNPNATAPIHPPTRRPRTRRFNGLQSPPGHTGYGAFPNSLLSALPVAEAELSPPPSKATLPHYSPLQQNLDRAVSPFADAERSQSTAMALPAIRAGNLPAPSTAALGTLSDLKENASTTGDDDSSTGDDILLASTFSVKSLTSLASYPNPMQKKAQNTLALAKARTAHYGINRPDTPSSLLSKPSVTGRNQSAIPYGTTSAAIGTPQPLTAGPPGQRPYKPSTTESTYRILRSYDDEKAPLRTPPGFSFMENESGVRGNPAFQSLASRKDELHGPGNRLHSISGTIPVDDRIKAAESAFIEDTEETFRHRFGNNNYLPSKVSPNKVPILDTLPLDKAMHYFRGGLPSSYNGQTSILDERWYERYPLQSRDASWNPSSEEQARRAEKTNRIFYSGVRLLETKADELLPISAARSSESKVGVIGGERREPSSNDENGCGDPLVTMALVSLLACKQDSKLNDPQNPFPSDWSKADPAWIDTSEDGNKSYFTAKPEPVKKKVAKRVTRRGY
ncbi:hypothetical protein QBC32DRAFT_254235 [Pseudoneurospora amorphoporcata]|uniref:Uncharacterized protein n=1 Tax=Pseudoneurospora amorphoporcata TaxID=241081 RepID=A0AAN6P1E8_9PEZI|nr:hypothetical protein QBC32DRAFT_254235 [Pseudoneurospora amorphoporcata]